MRIFDLTGLNTFDITKCHSCIKETMKDDYFPLRNFMYNRYLHTRWEKEMEELLDEVPIFLVNTAMADLFIEIKGKDLILKVPKPGPGKHKEDEPKEAELGVYYHNPEWVIMPRRIFVWLDNIKKEVDNHNSNHELPIQEEELLQLVINHEYAHALMDVTLYKAAVNSKFEDNDYVEEALANAFALRVMKKDNDIPENLVKYVATQHSGYNRGADVCSNPYLFEIINEWMKMKVLFDNTKDILKDFKPSYGKPDFNKLLDNSIDGISMFYPMGNHFRERYYGHVSFDAHTFIKTNEDGGIWFSDDIEKNRKDKEREWQYINPRGKTSDKKYKGIYFRFGRTYYTKEGNEQEINTDEL